VADKEPLARLFNAVQDRVIRELGEIRFNNNLTCCRISTSCDDDFYSHEEMPVISTDQWGKYLTKEDVVCITDKTILNLENEYEINGLISTNQNRALCAIIHEIVHSYRPTESINSLNDNALIEGVVESIARTITHSITNNNDGLDTYPAEHERAIQLFQRSGIQNNFEEIKRRFINDAF
jgi:hypothetical protein